MPKKAGLIFDIKRFAVHDGPGIRTTVFLKGCPLSCWWCHNPEGLSNKQEIMFYEYKCMNCDKCIEICSENAIKKIKSNRFRDYSLCASCWQCVEVCPTASQQLVGQWNTAEDIINEIKKDVVYFESSSGGVTFSGGEPLMQHGFLKEILRLCRINHIHTALDTSGYAPERIFDSILQDVDLFLYDLKIIDDQEHKKYTGVSNKSILKNLETLAELGKTVILRLSLIPEITASEQNIKNILDFISTLRGFDEINLLSYHNVNEKYIRLGKKHKMDEAVSLKVDEVKTIKEQFEQRGFNVRIGG